MPSLQAFAESWRRQLRPENKSRATLKTYGSAINCLEAYLAGHFESDDAAAISRPVLRDFYTARAESVKPATVSIEFRALRVFFRWAVTASVPAIGLAAYAISTVPGMATFVMAALLILVLRSFTYAISPEPVHS